MKALAVVLIVAGSIMMVITGINFVTREKVLDLGKVEISKTKNNPISWSPIVGAVLLAAGIGAFFDGQKESDLITADYFPNLKSQLVTSA